MFYNPIGKKSELLEVVRQWCAAHEVLDYRQAAFLYWQCQHGLEVAHTGPLT